MEMEMEMEEGSSSSSQSPVPELSLPPPFLHVLYLPDEAPPCYCMYLTLDRSTIPMTNIAELHPRHR